MRRKAKDAGLPFQCFKVVGSVLEPIPTPAFKTLGSVLDWAQRWVAQCNPLRCNLVCKQGWPVVFRVTSGGFVSLGDARRSPPPRTTKVNPGRGTMTNHPNIEKIA